MANTFNSIASPQNAVLLHCDLTAATACTTRAPTATASLAAANIVAAVPAVSTDTKITRISVKGSSTAITAATAGNLVQIWEHDGTKAWVIDEILVTAVTPSTTAASFGPASNPLVTTGVALYDDFTLPATHALYMSVTVTTTAATTALVAHIHGASF